MNVAKLLFDNNIECAEEGNRHYRQGWLNFACPFCGQGEGYHMGYCETSEYFTCWRCGWHSVSSTIMEILGVNFTQFMQLQKEYDTPSLRKEIDKKIGIKPCQLPEGTEPLSKHHKRYLHARKYNSLKIEEMYHVQGTLIYGKLDNIDYSRRLIIPIYWNRQLVSFDSRDITNKHKLRYIACPQTRERIEHKHILYGLPSAFEHHACIVVEGIFDAWRIGPGAVATFGINYTPEQIRCLCDTFSTCHILYDAEPQAQKQAKKLVSELQFRGINATNIELDKGDPGDLSQERANKIHHHYLHY